jgi:hypothetical protein
VNFNRLWKRRQDTWERAQNVRGGNDAALERGDLIERGTEVGGARVFALLRVRDDLALRVERGAEARTVLAGGDPGRHSECCDKSKECGSDAFDGGAHIQEP